MLRTATFLSGLDCVYESSKNPILAESLPIMNEAFARLQCIETDNPSISQICIFWKF